MKRRKADQLAGKCAGSDCLLTCEEVEAHVLDERGSVPAPDIGALASSQSQEATALEIAEQEDLVLEGPGGVGEESETGEE